MFNKSKIVKKDDAKVSELEEEVAKSLMHFEQSNSDLQEKSRFVLINSAEEVEYEEADGSMSKYIHIRIPYRSYAFYVSIGDKIVEHLENKFKCPVLIVANRTIISKRAKHHPSQMRPRSRTLKSVHNAILQDIVIPSHVTGRRTRVTLEGKRHERIYLDPLDREMTQHRLAAMAHCYAKWTTHKIHFEFSKPTSFQQKKLDSNKQKKN